MNPRKIAAVGAFCIAPMIGVPDAPAAKHISVHDLLERAGHGPGRDPYRCDIYPRGSWGPKQLECVIRTVFVPRSLADQAVRVAKCESGGGYLLADPPKNPASTAKGLFQFLDGTWRITPQYRHAYHAARRHGSSRKAARRIAAEAVRNPVQNTRGARWLYRTGGQWRQWVCQP